MGELSTNLAPDTGQIGMLLNVCEAVLDLDIWWVYSVTCEDLVDLDIWWVYRSSGSRYLVGVQI